ncbi:hypothetical protein [Acetobacter sp.]|jgi:hypothetical protein|uniref:hypothetical protein n=1 Tax=Acetobacter sp. TaxID=440 RepID=UPI0025BB82D7|nr:hypothetical protein [Acetobacter sp.]MCH4091345.1 hypothetical protein [Acetobacter sp.]MCI1299323.1 hypothetical protein [Acetobacter sp.]MCI1316673.1 hypothetical protein [Acetobacter sp.]
MTMLSPAAMKSSLSSGAPFRVIVKKAATGLTLAMLLAMSGFHHAAAAPHTKHHKAAAQHTDPTDLSSGQLAPATTARSLESQEGAPPPPDGYEPVEDIDETIESHYSLDVRKTPHGEPLPSIEAQQIPRDANNGATQFDIFGVPVKFIAPVAAPYNAPFTYHTYAGQSGRGGDAVGSVGSAGEP